MAYPRACPLCGTDYARTSAADLQHRTLGARDGGTASPWRPELPGRILTLRCLACGGTYEWDYFGAVAAYLARQLSVRASGGGPR